MNKQHFKRRSLGETLALLCEARGEPFFRDGKVNQSYIEEQTKIKQSTVSRWLSGSTKNVDKENVYKMAKLFKVTPGQLRGEEPIDWVDNIKVASKADVEFIERFKSHPDDLKEALLVYEQTWLKRNR